MDRYRIKVFSDKVFASMAGAMTVMRQKRLSNRVFQCFDDIVGHCCDAWNTLIEQPWKIMSLAGREWARIGQPI
jgi:hypothetical protein